MHLIGAEKVSLIYPDQQVLQDISLGISKAERIGLLGGNGSGKSSLLKILAGQKTPDEGRVSRRRDLRVGYLAQEEMLEDDRPAADYLIGAEQDFTARQIVSALIEAGTEQLNCGQLSVGQRRRVALAALLIQSWDVLILDEPTNHLDMPSVAWLAEHLRSRLNALLVVTHDRWFLDQTVEKIWDLNRGRIRRYAGDYSTYILARAEQEKQESLEESRRQNRLRKELEWLSRQPKARGSKAKFRVEAAQELLLRKPPTVERIELAQLEPAYLGKTVLEIENGRLGFENQPVFTDLNFNLLPKAKVGIVGANGCGKSTLIGLLTGELTLQGGKLRRGKTVKVARLEQGYHQLRGDQRVAELLAECRSQYRIGGKVQSPSQMLERLGVSDFSRRISDLSGGQKRRLQLLLTLLQEPNVLILDEPTNDVDIETVSAMEQFLNAWPGTLVVVSHDRYFLEHTVSDFYTIVGGRLRHLPAGISDFLSGGAAKTPESGRPADTSGSAPPAKAPNYYRRQKAVAALERKHEKLLQQIAEVDELLAGTLEYEELMELASRREALVKAAAEAEHEWLELLD